MLSFENKRLSYRLMPYCQCYQSPSVIPFVQESEKEEFNAKIRSLNEIIRQPELLNKIYISYLEKSRKNFLSSLEPYNSRIMSALFSRGLLPSFVKEKRKLQIFDWISCESHCEKFLHALK